MNRFEVEALDKGYSITVFEDTDTEIYEDPKKGAAATKEEVAGHFSRWLEMGGKGFTFRDNESL